jgi:flagellar motor switch protein FliM
MMSDEDDKKNDKNLSEEEQLKAFQDAIDNENKAKGLSEEEQIIAFQNAKSKDNDKSFEPTIDAAAVLDQEAIDKLFEDENKDTSQVRSNVLLNKRSHENKQFPLLDIVFDKFTQFFAESVGNFLQNRVDFIKVGVRSGLYKQYIDSIALPALFNIFKIKEWESKGLVMVNNSLVYFLINVLLGGKKNNTTRKEKAEGRTFSKLESNIVERFVSLALNDLGEGFSFIHPMEFEIERQETIPKHIGLIPDNAFVSYCTFKISLGEFDGVLDIVLPHTSLEPIREDLVNKNAVDDSMGKINNWRPYLEEKVLTSDIEISAVLLEDTISLLDVLNWKPGSSIPLDIHHFDEVTLRADNIELFTGKVGQQNSMISIEIDNIEESLESFDP